jgi:hypothetical protein
MVRDPSEPATSNKELVAKVEQWDQDAYLLVMKQDFFTYKPQFTLWCAGNHKPAFRTTDEAIRRRVLLVPVLAGDPGLIAPSVLPRAATTYRLSTTSWPNTRG